MGKASRRKRRRVEWTQEITNREGRFTVNFVFDTKVYTKTHQLTPFEVNHMKDLCKEFGDIAADQVIWRAAIKGIGMVAESCLAIAALEYIASHRKESEVEAVEPARPVALGIDCDGVPE